MGLDEKILNEIARYNSINKYIMEQDAPPPADPLAGAPPPADAAAGAPPADAAAGAPPPPPAPAEATPVDVAADKDVEEIPTGEEGAEGEEEGTEELDITDLVDSQKTMADKQEEYFNNLFDQIKNMEEKLAEMDTLVSKIDSIGPYKQNLADFFDEKKDEMEATGKNEYVLTQDEVENFSPSEIENSFNEPMEDEDDILLNKYNS
jgi:hypothetical protein